MNHCPCTQPHVRRRVVLTGGPGAGKTAVLELVRQSFCTHVDVLPEAASILFAGGFRRGAQVPSRRAAQRAVFHVQRELETVAMTEGNPAVVLCDRGTVDGYAYWPGPDDFWGAMGTTRVAEISRYDAVIHLRTPSPAHGYNHLNPLRTETAVEAAEIDARIAHAWEGHPRLHIVESTTNFLEKAHRAIELIRAEVPGCCAQKASAATVLHLQQA